MPFSPFFGYIAHYAPYEIKKQSKKITIKIQGDKFKQFLGSSLNMKQIYAA